MKVKATTLRPHPDYEAHIAMNLDTDSGGKVSMEELQESIKAYKLSPGTEMKDIMIPGPDGVELKLRVITPAGLPENSPVILDIHGGGFVSGGLDIDNYRNIYLAEHTPCIVTSIEYRLATRENKASDLLMDCHAAYMWLCEHAGEIGGDPARIGIHGTSAGGNLSAGLALWIRDHGEPTPALTVLNCPALDVVTTNSKRMFGGLGSAAARFVDEVDSIFLKPDGGPISYYSMPLHCPNLFHLGPHMVVVAEYDPLRDYGLQYAMKLFADRVPCELIAAGRVTHGFCVVDKPLTHWVHDGVCASFRREFGIKDKV